MTAKTKNAITLRSLFVILIIPVLGGVFYFYKDSIIKDVTHWSKIGTVEMLAKQNKENIKEIKTNYGKIMCSMATFDANQKHIITQLNFIIKRDHTTKLN